ncbi:MAG: hypothetical protein Q7S40_17975 [Opitutaceae bacterium]|nr:hypothetical protein [Opitutaceae bacterium]
MHKSALFLLLVLAGSTAANAQSYTWTTLAGLPPQTGTTDGPATGARYFRPGGIIADAAGTVYVADTYNHSIRKLAADGSVTTLAGLGGTSGSTDATGSAARFFNPQGLAVDSSGNLYVADSGNHVIRKVTAAGVVTTFAGVTRTSGSNDGAASEARFNNPFGLAFGRDGNLYVADRGNHTLRRISPAGAVTTVAGLAGTSGATDGVGADARFFGPAGITSDADGNIYLADSSNYTIRKITPDGIVSTLAGSPRLGGTLNGTGSAARFSLPYGVALDSSGNVYVADSNNDTIRRITPAGVVTTFAGAADQRGSVNGTGSAARFFTPTAIAASPGGSLYVADTLNHSIRRITPAAVVTTFSGPGGNFGNTDGPGTAARFNYAHGLGPDGDGNLFITDTRNSSIRMVTPDGVVSTFARLPSIGFYGMAVDRFDNLVVSDITSDTVRIYSASSGAQYFDVGTAGRPGAVDGDFAMASFNNPYGVALDPSFAFIYVADSSNHTIRRIAISSTTGVTVSTLAGSPGVTGSADGPGPDARFNFPQAITVDRARNVYVFDTNNYTIRKISPSGFVTTLAGGVGIPGTTNGTGAAARFLRAGGMTVDATGILFVSDAAGSTIRRVSPAGAVSTIGGATGSGVTHAEGTGTAARFFEPGGITAGPDGAIYFVDTSNNVVMKGVLDSVPLITAPPQSLPVLPGTTVNLAVGATGGGLRYQWRFGGTIIPGATSATYTIPAVQAPAAGNYTVDVTNSAGMTTTEPAVLSVVETANVGRIINLAIRSKAGTAAETLIVGLGIGGNNTQGTKPILFRCVGPALGAFGVPDVLSDPKLELYDSGSRKINENDNWGGDSQLTAISTQVGAFALGAATSRDAALYVAAMNTPGSYTVQMTGSGGATGIVLAEIYDSTPADNYTATTPRLINVSARTRVGVAGDILIAGFVIGGSTAKTVLIRAIGPTLGAFGVPGALEDPKLELFAGTTRINQNDNWGGATTVAAAALSVGAFPLVATTRDAALLVTLAPGSYTAQVSGVNNATGVALVEVYEAP